MTPEPITAPLAARHGFFTRVGGVSTGPYATLNAGLKTGDDPDRVRENRARAARTLGADPAHLVGLHQVHGAEVVRVTTPWLPGKGPKADAMVTDRPGIALGIITADCAPVLFDGGHVVGAAHAGWRGAVAGVLEAVVATMRDLGATRISAAIGPCIRQASYEVGPDLRAALLAHDPADARYLATGRREGHWQFDLAGYCASRLAGVAVHVIEADTMAMPDHFFSHRRRTLGDGGPIGHQISMIVCG